MRKRLKRLLSLSDSHSLETSSAGQSWLSRSQENVLESAPPTSECNLRMTQSFTAVDTVSRCTRRQRILPEKTQTKITVLLQNN